MCKKLWSSCREVENWVGIVLSFWAAKREIRERERENL
jgi:hypothetical protein